MRRRSSPAASPATSVAKAGSGQRRNGLPALTWMTITSCRWSTPAARSRSAIRASAPWSSAISAGSRAGSGGDVGPPGERREQRPLVHDRMPAAAGRAAGAPSACTASAAPECRSRCARARRSPRSATSCAGRHGGRSTTSNRSARSRRARPEVVADPLPPARARDDDHLGEVRVAGYDRRGVAFHEVGQAGFRKRPLEGPEKRRREDHVADETQADEQYLHVSAARRQRLGCPGRRTAPCYGSTVASSSSMTGISSLIG